MIPKIIHYCWFGNQPKPLIIRQCIDSWQKHNPAFQIIEWNETNAPKHPIVQKNLKDGMWAFASDYVRIYAMITQGGIYLDTDILLLKPLDKLLIHSCFIAFQYTTPSKYWVNNAACGAQKGSAFFRQSLSLLEKRGHSKLNQYISPELTTNTLHLRANTIVYGDQQIDEVTLLDIDYFYYYQKADLNAPLEELINHLPTKAIGIHLYAGSWIGPSNIKNRREQIHILFSKIGKKCKLIIEQLKLLKT